MRTSDSGTTPSYAIASAASCVCMKLITASMSRCPSAPDFRRIGRADKGADVGDPQRAEHLFTLRRSKPVLGLLHIVVGDHPRHPELLSSACGEVAAPEDARAYARPTPLINGPAGVRNSYASTARSGSWRQVGCDARRGEDEEADINGILLPVTLFFVWRLAASGKLMGEHANGRTFNLIAGVTVAVTSALSLTLLAVTFVG